MMVVSQRVGGPHVAPWRDCEGHNFGVGFKCILPTDSEPQFPLLQNGSENSTYFIG